MALGSIFNRIAIDRITVEFAWRRRTAGLESKQQGGLAMQRLGLPPRPYFPQVAAGQVLRRFAMGLLLSASAIAIAATGFLVRVNLATASSLELFLVLLVALRLGFVQATMVSITAFLCLNFLFTAPVFTFIVADPQNWVSLFTFEATALLVSVLSTKVRLHAAQAEEQRARAEKLYALSRAVLLIDQRGSTSDQLSNLIRETFEVDDVQFWIAYDTTDFPRETEPRGNQPAYAAYLEEKDSDDLIDCSSQRVLRVGTNIMGGMTMRGWKVDPLSADAIASIAATTFFARTRSILLESRAEVERDAERLRVPFTAWRMVLRRRSRPSGLRARVCWPSNT